MESVRTGKMPQFYRQRFILALLQVFGGNLAKTDFQKYLFLFQQECAEKQEYYFVPYKFGPFSFQAYADLRRLDAMGLLRDEDCIKLTDSSNFIGMLKRKDKASLERFFKQYNQKKGDDLVKYVYHEYPYFAIKSEIKGKYGLSAIKDSSSEYHPVGFCTLGYEAQTIDQYLNILVMNDIRVVIDVRKNPISMKYGFSKTTLQNALKNLGIEYVHFPELGIDTMFRKDLSGYEDYQALFKLYERDILPKQKEAVQKVFDIYKNKKRVVLTCFEKDANYCHRSSISRLIENRYNVSVRHL